MGVIIKMRSLKSLQDEYNVNEINIKMAEECYDQNKKDILETFYSLAKYTEGDTVTFLNKIGIKKKGYIRLISVDNCDPFNLSLFYHMGKVRTLSNVNEEQTIDSKPVPEEDIIEVIK